MGGMALWWLVEKGYKSLLRWGRRSRLKEYAAMHGYSFYEQHANRCIQFNWSAFFDEQTEDYQFDPAINIIEGSMSGLKFSYFEIAQVVASGFSARDLLGVRSIVAFSENDRFQSGYAIDKNLTFCRDNGAILFYCSDDDGKEAIWLDKLDQWLIDIASTFKAEAVTTA